MFRQEDRPQTTNRRHVPLRVEGTSLLLGTLSPLFDRHSGSFVAFSNSIDRQLAKLEDRWANTPTARDAYALFFSESSTMTKTKPR